MKRISGQVLTLVAATVALSVVIPACTDNDRSIYVEAVLAPSTTRTGGACTYTNDPTQAYEPIGRLDVAASQAYIATVLFGNQLIGRGDQGAPRAESNRVHLEGAVVHLADPSGALAFDDFTSLTSGFANASANNVPGFGVTFVPLTDAKSTSVLRGALKNRSQSTTILAVFKLFGKTLGNTDVETGNFSYPIEVCNGCLIGYGKGIDTATGKCTNPVDDALAQSTSNPCFLGQDLVTDCRLCVGLQQPDVCLNPPAL